MTLLTGQEVVEIAIQLEERGEAFYAAAAERASTAGVRALFQDLAAQERAHRKAFQQLSEGAAELALAPEQWDEFRAYTGALLGQSFFAAPGSGLNMAAAAGDERSALQAALAFEKEAILFFHELEAAVRGPGLRTVQRIVEEEKRHVQRLAQTLVAGAQAA